MAVFNFCCCYQGLYAQKQWIAEKQSDIQHIKLTIVCWYNNYKQGGMAMNILITGANGFVGKNLVQSLYSIRDGKDRTRPELK